MENLINYRKKISQEIDKNLLKNNPFLLIKGLSFMLVSFLLIYIIYSNDFNILINLILSLCLGYLWGCVGLFSHDLLHGSIIKNKPIEDLISLIIGVPLLMTPEIWRYWHNYLHHSYFNIKTKDPDFVKTPNQRSSKIYKVIYQLTPESRSLMSYFYVFYWFNIQSLLLQFYLRFSSNPQWKNVNHKKVNIQFVIQLILLTLYLNYIAINNLIFLFIIPLLLINYIPLSFIITNHYRRNSNKNHILERATSVYVNSIHDFFTFRFGYHVEHHLLPYVPSSSFRDIHDILMKDDRYHYKSKWSVIKSIYIK